MALLPLFPLRLVVFPGSAVPLHIFEERYREMVGRAEAEGTEFGIVLARDGGIVNSGCTVLVETVLKRYEDGRFDVLTRGQRRFLIQSIDHEQDCLRGDVQFFDDDTPEFVMPELRKAAVAAFRKMETELPLDEGHPFLSFQLAEAIDDLDFRNLLQRSRSEAERLRSFIECSDGLVERKLYVEKMKKAAPMNGHGHKRPVN